MTHVLTLVAASPQNPLEDSHIRLAGAIAAEDGLEYAPDPVWLAEGKAADILLSGAGAPGMTARIRAGMAGEQIDVFVTNRQGRRKKLLLADMDSTIVAGETLDDMAGFAGLKAQIAAITARAMNGELDFHAALEERVGLLKGLSTQALEKTLAHTALNPGARTFVATMQKYGATCVLVSGGFTFFTGAIAERAGFDHHHGNVLGIETGTGGETLSGEVIPPVLDKFAKVGFLEHYTSALGLREDECLAIGDGANDIPMLERAGLGIGYRPKPAVAAAITNLILHGDLSAALYAQGYGEGQFA